LLYFFDTFLGSKDLLSNPGRDEHLRDHERIWRWELRKIPVSKTLQNELAKNVVILIPNLLENNRLKKDVSNIK